MPRYVAPVVGTGYAGAVLADLPLFYARLDETSGTTLADSSGNSRDATLVGTHFTRNTGLTSDGGKSLAVFGVDTYASVASASWMSLSSSFAYEVIVKPATSLSNVGIMSRWQNGNSNGDGLIWFNTSGKIEGAWVIGGSTVRAAWATTPTANAVYHLVMSYTGAALILYVNGSAVATTPATGSAATLATDLRVGQYGPGTTSAGNHVVDEPAVYTSLSATRVAAHYAAL